MITDKLLNNQKKTRQKIRKILFENPKYGFDKGLEYMTKLYDGNISAQQYGLKYENFVLEKFKAEKVKQTDGKGDIKFNNKYIEIKASILNDSNNGLNLVQLRLYQEIDFYLFIACDYRKTEPIIHYFFLTKEELTNELKECKATNAHGTKKANELNINKELRMTLKIDNKNEHFNRWKLKYNYNSLEDILKRLN